jgi:uncharacterized XkdX family phage protein
MFEKIKKWYSMGLWDDEMVRHAVEKGVITEAQYKSIVGEGVANG